MTSSRALPFARLCAGANLALALASAALAPSVAAGPPPPEEPAGPAVMAAPAEPFDLWAVDFDSSLLWRATDTTPLNYTVLATALSARTPQHLHWDAGPGDLYVRGNFSLLAEAFLEGPESYYFGISGSPSIEYWLPGHRTHLYLQAGGGVGVVDSTEVEGGQGQDLTFNWFVRLGIRHSLRDNLAVSAGVHFQHLSNRGMADRNPGLDALGPSVGLTWRF